MASIRLSGADRLTWLQGQVTNDVFAASRFCLCAPNGQIEGVFSMRAEGESHVLESTVSGCEALLRRVADFVILEDVVAEGLNSSPCLQGEVAAERSEDDGGGLEPDFGEVPPSPSFYSGTPPCKQGGEFPEPPFETTFLSLAAGEIDPRFDIPPGTVPADLGERFFNAHVSLTKGCYTGQEVIHRMHARGAGKKTWVVLELGEPPKDPSALTRWATDGTRILAGAFVPRPQAIVGEEIDVGGTSARIVMLG